MLPHLRERPVTMERFPAGIGEKGFLQKDVSKGFHVVTPLDGRDGFPEVAAMADAVGRTLVERDPEHLTLEFMKADRGGRIFVDINRNEYSATFAAAYAVRARPGAPVSAPCS